MKTTRIIGGILVIVAILIFAFVWFKNSPQGEVPLVFSDKSMLETLWNNYKEDYIEPGTFRALDKQQDNITTSEGQSYTLLRAVWMDDKETYDAAYKWLNDNMKRKDDHLYSWLFGKKANGSYEILTERGGNNTANDADSDIALSLIFANKRWNQQNYLDDAKNIINDLWTTSVVTIKGVPYLTADNLEKNSSSNPIVNPSYLSPYAYKIFATVDKAHDWNAVASSSYAVLNATADLKLDKDKSSGLPADWVSLNRQTGEVLPANAGSLTTNFSYDALRTPWRVALDYQWNKDERAKQYLDKLNFLTQEWESKKSIASVYEHNGNVVSSNEAPAMYGGVIGYFMVSDTKNAQAVYDQKLKFLYDSDINAFRNDLSYYDSNWVWFGMGLYQNLLPNLSK